MSWPPWEHYRFYFFFIFFIIRLRPKLKHLLCLVMWRSQARYNAQGSPCQVVSKGWPCAHKLPSLSNCGPNKSLSFANAHGEYCYSSRKWTETGALYKFYLPHLSMQRLQKDPRWFSPIPQLCSVDWGVYNREIIEEFKGIFTLWLKLTSSHNALPPWASGAHSDLC